MSKRLDGRIALVTGASRGIGRAVAKRYAEEGAHPILVARTQAALEELDDEIRSETGVESTLVPLDLRDFDAIDKVGAAMYERFGKLDILVANAGLLGVLTPMHQLDPKVWDEVMSVNLTACFRLLRSMDPLLRASDSGRSIYVTSVVGHVPRAFWSAYAVSKAGLDMMVRTYAEEITKTNMRVNILNPGATRTGMRAAAMPGEDPNTLKTPESIAHEFVRLGSPECDLNGEMITAEPEA
ncbi:MAG: SDR family NAD(P)-dependent oxidoreductase [Rhodospirillales bacterium]|nr:SDR family NAD(P)-dependent oxidoreductase [Rhodospirillales bacterium]MBO6786226.1 SDR family NAD(P)-dependent oxidoreductase [Rhodospirillales bacterium]